MVSVRMVTATSAAPFSGVDWLMVTMLAPAALMPASRLCSALLRIEEQLGGSAVYPGMAAFNVKR